MKRISITFVCMLACLLLLVGCRNDQNGSDDSAGAKSVEVDISEPESDNDEPSSETDSSGDIVYSFRNPEDSDGIVITPRE